MLQRTRTEFSFELPERVSPAFWLVDFSLLGWSVDAMESEVPLMESPACSVVDFWESGCERARQHYWHTASTQ